MTAAITPSAPPPPPVEFPESITAGSRPNWRRRVLTVAGLAIVVALVAGVGVARASGSGTAGYRTATVSTQDVESVLTGVGSIEPTSQVTVTFPVAGTVATVDVRVGQSVGTGQQIATLDAQELSSALDQKQAALATAELTLSKALAGATAPSAGATSGTGSSGTTGAGWGPVASPGSTAVSDAQHAVVAAQHAVDTSLAAADAALAQAAQVCGPSPAPATPSPSTSTSTSTAPPPRRPPRRFRAAAPLTARPAPPPSSRWRPPRPRWPPTRRR